MTNLEKLFNIIDKGDTIYNIDDVLVFLSKDIKEAIESKKYNKSEIAKRLNMHPSNFSNRLAVLSRYELVNCNEFGVVTENGTTTLVKETK